MSTLEDLISDPCLYIEKLMKIEDKERHQIPFTLRSIQRDILSSIQPEGSRVIELKARQIGSTYAVMAFFLAECLTIPGTVSVVVSADDFSTKRLLDKAHKLYRSVPDQLKPPIHHASSFEMTWPDLGSAMYIRTARAGVIARGDTVHNLLLSEVAQYIDPETIVADAEESVPITGRIVMESTPNGEGDFFHLSYLDAVESNSAYKPLFFPWWRCPDYQLPLDSPMALEPDRGTFLPTPEEWRFMQDKGLSLEQIRWRRRKQADRKLFFIQEYPEDPVTCFLTTGTMVFDKDILDTLSHQCVSAKHSFENAQVWYPPEENAIYLIAVDPTVGVNDKAAVTVWKPGNPLLHCATLWGLYEPTILAQKIASLGRYYNVAQLQIEFNGPGQALFATETLNHYPNIGYRRDPFTGQIKAGQPGWLTTRTSKPLMKARLEALLPSILTHDLNLIRQLRAMRWEGPDMMSPTEDDLAMSAMIAAATISGLVTIQRGLVGVYGWGDNW